MTSTTKKEVAPTKRTTPKGYTRQTTLSKVLASTQIQDPNATEAAEVTLVVNRESDRGGFKEWGAQFEKILTTRVDTLPGARTMLGYGTTLVARDIQGATLRETLGAEPYYAEDSREVLGWLVKLEGTLFFLALNSAASGKTSIDEQYKITATNSFTTALVAIVLRHNVTKLITGPLSRVMRVAKLAIPLREALQQTGAVVESTVDGRFDMSNDSGLDNWDLQAMFIERSYKQIVGGLTNGKHNLLLTGRWPGSEYGLPSIGYKFRAAGDPTVVPDLEKLELVRDFITWCAEDEATLSNEAIVDKLSEKHGWASANLRKRVLKDNKAVASEAVCKGAVVMNALKTGLGVWSTGTYEYNGEIPTALKTDNLLEAMRGKVMEGVVDGKVTRAFKVDLDFHHELLPDGKWTDQELIEKAARRLNKEKKVYKARTDDRKPLRGMSEWTEGDTQYILSGAQGNNYVLAARPTSTSINAHGAARGWMKNELHVSNQLQNYRTAETHQAIADAVITALEDGSLATRAGLVFEDAQSAEEPDTLLTKINTLRAAAAKHAEALDIALESGLRKQVVHYMGLKEAAEEELSALEVELGHSTKAAENRLPINTESVFVGELIDAMAALRETDNFAPSELSGMLQKVIHRIRVTPSEDGLYGILSVWVRLTTDNGVIVAGPITTKVRDRKKNNATDRREGVLKAVLTEGARYKEATEKAGYKMAAMRLHVNTALAPIMPEGSLRTAAIDCPIPEVKLVVWEMLNAHREGRAFETPEGMDKNYAEHIRRTYSDQDLVWACTWAADNMTPQRAAIEFVLGHDDAKARWMDVRAVVNNLYPNQDTKRMFYGMLNGSDGSNACVYTPMLEKGKGFTRDNEDRTVQARKCPFCKTHTLTHALHVPEVTGGLLCTTCRRTPMHTKVVFPESYLRNWGVQRGHSLREKVADVGTIDMG